MKHVPFAVVKDIVAHKVSNKDKQIIADVQNYNERLTNPVPVK